MKIVYPAGGWLPPGAHLEFQRDDQGKDLVTDWRGPVQAPGRGQCIHVLSDRSFPNGFGPGYPVVRIDTGPFAGHDWYLGHTSTRVQEGEHFEFGHVLSLADQGKDFNGTHGGWIELGEAPGGYPGSTASSHWFDQLLYKPLVRNVPDPPLRFGDRGLRVLGMSSRLRDCGYLPRPYWNFNRDVHGAVVAFKKHHRLPVPRPDGGVVDQRTDAVLSQASEWCKKHHKKEV